MRLSCTKERSRQFSIAQHKAALSKRGRDLKGRTYEADHVLFLGRKNDEMRSQTQERSIPAITPAELEAKSMKSA
jgi:hypothetical protein